MKRKKNIVFKLLSIAFTISICLTSLALNSSGTKNVIETKSPLTSNLENNDSLRIASENINKLGRATITISEASKYSQTIRNGKANFIALKHDNRYWVVQKHKNQTPSFKFTFNLDSNLNIIKQNGTYGISEGVSIFDLTPTIFGKIKTKISKEIKKTLMHANALRYWKLTGKITFEIYQFDSNSLILSWDYQGKYNYTFNPRNLINIQTKIHHYVNQKHDFLENVIPKELSSSNQFQKLKDNITNDLLLIDSHIKTTFNNLYNGNFSINLRVSLKESYNSFHQSQEYNSKILGWYHQGGNKTALYPTSKRIHYVYRKNRILKGKYFSELPKIVNNEYFVDLYPKIFFVGKYNKKELLYVNNHEISVLNGLFEYDLEKNANNEFTKTVEVKDDLNNVIYKRIFKKIPNSGVLKYRWLGWNPNINEDQKLLITKFNSPNSKTINPLYDPNINPSSGMETHIMWFENEELNHKANFIKLQNNTVLQKGAFVEVAKSKKGIVIQLPSNAYELKITKLEPTTNKFHEFKKIFLIDELDLFKDKNKHYFSQEGTYLFSLSTGLNKIRRYYLIQIGEAKNNLFVNKKLRSWENSPFGLILKELAKKFAIEEDFQKISYEKLLDLWINSLLLYLNEKQKWESSLDWEMTYSNSDLAKNKAERTFRRILLPDQYDYEKALFKEPGSSWIANLSTNQQSDYRHIYFKNNVSLDAQKEFYSPKFSWDDLRDEITLNKTNYLLNEESEITNFLGKEDQKYARLFIIKYDSENFGLRIKLKEGIKDKEIDPYFQYRRLYLDSSYHVYLPEALKGFEFKTIDDLNLQGATKEDKIKVLIFKHIKKSYRKNNFVANLEDLEINKKLLSEFQKVALKGQKSLKKRFEFVYKQKNKNILITFGVENKLEKDKFTGEVDLSKIALPKLEFHAQNSLQLKEQLEKKLQIYLQKHNLKYKYDLTIENWKPLENNANKSGNFSFELTFQKKSNNLVNNLKIKVLNSNNDLKHFELNFSTIIIPALFTETNNYEELLKLILQHVLLHMQPRGMLYDEDYEISKLYDTNILNSLLKQTKANQYNRLIFKIKPKSGVGFEETSLEVNNTNVKKSVVLKRDIDNGTRDKIENISKVKDNDQERDYGFLGYVIPLSLIGLVLIGLLAKYLYHYANKKLR